MTLTELINRHEGFELVVMGQTFAARVLSTEDVAVLERLRPEPLPPANRKDPGKGSLAPLVPNEHDEQFRREVAAWWPEMCADMVTAAVCKSNCAQLGGEAVPWPGNPAANIDAARTCLERGRGVVRRLPMETLLRAAAEVRGAWVAMEEKLRKNSSCGEGMTGTTMPGSPHNRPHNGAEESAEAAELIRQALCSSPR